MNSTPTVAIVGLGYVGLPLALAFGKKFDTIGFDVSEEKIHAYRSGKDPTGEMPAENFGAATLLRFTNDAAALKDAARVIVAVPTPIDSANRPDMTALISASETVGKNLKKGAIVIFESTVYPGVTEEVCGPVLEQCSGLKCGVDFKLGYSPERINPGDKEHTLEKIIKVVAGQDAESSREVSALYSAIIDAGVHAASSIKVAEAAKVIENTQRDLNIALMNELAIIFHRLGIDTEEVLKAAGTKWNFLPFRPGLVGGHCIGVDPYYLTHKAEMLGYHPEVILAGRRINDSMGAFIASETVKKIAASGRPLNGAKVLLMGLTFKENVADLRNSKVIDIYTELRSYGLNVEIWDPVADPREAEHEYGVKLIKNWSDLGKIDAIVAAVAHREIKSIKLDELVHASGKGAAFIDVKCAFDPKILRELGFFVWRL